MSPMTARIIELTKAKAALGPVSTPADVDRVLTGLGVIPPDPDAPDPPELPGAFATGRPLRYLVKGLLNLDSQVTWYGAPGAGKTYSALDLAAAIATGREWMDRRVRQGAVLYLVYEGAAGLKRRVKALIQQRRLEPDSPLYVKAASWRFDQQTDRQALAKYAAQLPRLSLIVIDTLAHALGSGDENSAKDMGEFNKTVALLKAKTGACILVVHHSGKNAENGARGSSALLGAVDTEICVEPGLIRSTKQRDMDGSATIGFRLVPVYVEDDEDGDPLYACLVEPAPISNTARLPKGIKGTAVRVVRDHGGPMTRQELREGLVKAGAGSTKSVNNFMSINGGLSELLLQDWLAAGTDGSIVLGAKLGGAG